MKKIALFSTIVLLTACGKPSLPEPNEFTPHLEKFRRIGISHGRKNSVQNKVGFSYGTAPNGQPAFCETGFLQEPRITVDSRAWNRLPEISREILIFHELGHCLLSRGHRNDLVPMGDGRSARAVQMPASVMNGATLVGAPFYIQQNSYYMKELFQH